MRELSEVAALIRAVREAQRKFLRLWAMELAVIHPGLDRIAQDVDAASGGARPITHFELNDDADYDDDD